MAAYLSISLLGCATSPNRQLERQACIKGKLADFWGDQNAHVGVNFLPIKAKPFSTILGLGYHCTDPGTRKLLVSAARGPGLGVNAVVIVNLESGHDYRIIAFYRSGIYKFEIIDKTLRATPYTFTFPEGYYGFDVFHDKIVRDPLDLTK